MGKKGADGQFNYPSGLSHNSAGNIVVADGSNARIQVFSPAGRWISKFGQDVLRSPSSISVTSDDNIVVYDMIKKTMNVFSPEGMLLLQFDSCPRMQSHYSSLTSCYAIFHDEKFFVSVQSHVVKVFDTRGSHLYDIIGQKGNMEGQFSETMGLAVDTNDLLLVCDKGNKLVHLVTLEGEFVTSFGGRQLSLPQGITISPRGFVVVCDSDKDRVLVFHPEY